MRRIPELTPSPISKSFSLVIHYHQKISKRVDITSQSYTAYIYKALTQPKLTKQAMGRVSCLNFMCGWLRWHDEIPLGDPRHIILSFRFSYFSKILKGNTENKSGSRGPSLLLWHYIITNFDTLLSPKSLLQLWHLPHRAIEHDIFAWIQRRTIISFSTTLFCWLSSAV